MKNSCHYFIAWKTLFDVLCIIYDYQQSINWSAVLAFFSNCESYLNSCEMCAVDHTIRYLLFSLVSVYDLLYITLAVTETALILRQRSLL